MSEDIPTRMFPGSTSHQLNGELVRITTLGTITYRLDHVTEQGATFRSSIQSRYGTRKPEVSWLVATPRHPHFTVYPSRKAARARIGAEA